MEALSLIVFIFPLAMLYGGASDVLTLKIPNRVSLALFVGFLLAAPIVGMSLSEFGMHLAAGALVLAAAFVLFQFGHVGGGDAKLLAAAAFWMGFEHLMMFLIYVGLIGGALALMVLALRSIPIAFPAAVAPWIGHLQDRTQGIPYGIAITGGGLVMFPKTLWYAAVFPV